MHYHCTRNEEMLRRSYDLMLWMRYCTLLVLVSVLVRSSFSSSLRRELSASVFFYEDCTWS